MPDGPGAAHVRRAPGSPLWEQRLLARHRVLTHDADRAGEPVRAVVAARWLVPEADNGRMIRHGPACLASPQHGLESVLESPTGIHERKTHQSAP